MATRSKPGKKKPIPRLKIAQILELAKARNATPFADEHFKDENGKTWAIAKSRVKDAAQTARSFGDHETADWLGEHAKVSTSAPGTRRSSYEAREEPYTFKVNANGTVVIPAGKYFWDHLPTSELKGAEVSAWFQLENDGSVSILLAPLTDPPST